MTYHVRLTLTATAFVLFVYGEKLLLNHKMNKPLPWYVVLSLYSPSASKLSSKSLICPRLRLGQMFTFRTIPQPRACITQYNIPRKWFIHKMLYYTILYYTILYSTLLYYTILYYTILYYTILYYTILYYISICQTSK